MDLVLIVDKNESGISEAEQALAGARCRIVTTASYARGLAYARSGSPNAIILGVYPDFRDSLEALREIRTDSLAKNIPVIVILTKPDDAFLSRIQQFGVSEVILRPIDRNASIAKLRSALNTDLTRQEKAAKVRVNHITISHPDLRQTLIEFKSGLKKFVVPQFRTVFTTEFRAKTRGHKFCIDLRDLPDMSPEEVEILEKLLPVFSGPVAIIAGRHMGTILTFGDIEEKVQLFFSMEEYTAYLETKKK